MRTFQIFLYVLAFIPLLTGAYDLGMSLHGHRYLGAEVPPEAFGDPLLNSQLRYFGAIWLGFGATLLVVASDLPKYSSLLRVMLGIVFLGGLGRVASIIQFGWPSNTVGILFVASTTAIEIVGMALLFWWFSHVMNQIAQGALADRSAAASAFCRAASSISGANCRQLSIGVVPPDGRKWTAACTVF